MPYHHGNLREALIDAATELAREGGPDAVTLREAARRVGVSHNAAYRHFADRDDLLHAVSARVMTLFGRVVAERVAAVTGSGVDAAWDRLEASGRGYVEFATTEPGLFRLGCAYSLSAVGPDDADVQHPYGELSARLDELVETGVLPAQRRPGAEIGAWSLVHGFAMLVLDGPLQFASEDDRAVMLDHAMQLVREGL